MFSTRPLLRDCGEDDHGRPLYELAEDLDFCVGLNGVNGLVVRVPEGFRTDLASVPRLLWPIFAVAGRWSAAAILHDYLYSLPGCSRFLADALFREAMHSLDVPLWRRAIMYYAVRLFGWWQLPVSH